MFQTTYCPYSNQFVSSSDSRKLTSCNIVFIIINAKKKKKKKETKNGFDKNLDYQKFKDMIFMIYIEI